MKIAIIGGIGSGKSEVLGVARQRGIAALSADEINTELLADSDYISIIDRAFPAAVKDGVVDRGELAKIVFTDDFEREKLNALAHPRILKRIEEDDSECLVVEMPLLLEINAQNLFDEIVYVKTPLLKRIKLLRKRGMGFRQAVLRIRAQAKPRELGRIATRILRNDKDLKSLQKQTETLLDELII